MALQFKGPQYQQGSTNPLEPISRALGAAQDALKTKRLKNLDKEIGDYFTGSNLYDGGLNVIDGELSYSATNKLPTFAEAWANYKKIYSDNGETAGMGAYQQFKTIYGDMVKMYGSQLNADIRKMSNAGYSERDIRNALTANDTYLSNLNTLFSDPQNGPQYAATFSPYSPKKSILSGMADSPGTTGGGLLATGVGAGLAYKALTSVPEEAMDVAKGAYKESLGSARKILNKANANADKLVDDVKKTPAYKKLDGRSKAAKEMVADAKKSAEQIKSEALKKFKASRAEMKLKPETRGGKYSKMLGKTPNLAKGVGYAAVPMMIEGAITELTDSTDAGEIGGESAAASMTIAQAMQSGAKLKPALTAIKEQFKKHGTAKVLRHVMKKGGMGLAARTLAKAGAGTIGGLFTGGAMTALMAAWSLKDLYDISQIIADM